MRLQSFEDEDEHEDEDETSNALKIFKLQYSIPACLVLILIKSERACQPPLESV